MMKRSAGNPYGSRLPKGFMDCRVKPGNDKWIANALLSEMAGT
jgi:hypothetical protein